MNNKGNREDPKRKEKKKQGLGVRVQGFGDGEYQKNKEHGKKKENKQTGEEWPEMACQYHRPGCTTIPPAV